MTALHNRYGTPQALPLDVLLAAIPSLPRHALNRLVDQAIERMDLDDGDPDLEPDGDELDGANGEDAFWHQMPNMGMWGGPGCPIAEPDVGADDIGEDDRSGDV